MATFTRSAQRLLLAGGFAVAASAAPLLIAVATPSGPASPALATCPPNEVLDPVSGACKTAEAPTTFNPIEPGVTDLQPGALTQTGPGEVGTLPEVNGIPCNGGNTGLCIGLQQQNAIASSVPQPNG